MDNKAKENLKNRVFFFYRLFYSSIPIAQTFIFLNVQSVKEIKRIE